jgi:hypothetical protein
MSHQEAETVVFWYSNDTIYHELFDKPHVFTYITSYFGARGGAVG